jgi:hypothetical protein
MRLAISRLILFRIGQSVDKFSTSVPSLTFHPEISPLKGESKNMDLISVTLLTFHLEMSPTEHPSYVSDIAGIPYRNIEISSLKQGFNEHGSMDLMLEMFSKG